MNKLRSICLLGLGEVGATLAADLTGNTGLDITSWDLLIATQGSRPAAAARQFPAVRVAASAVTAVQECDLVISAVTAGQALAAASSVLPGLRPGCWFLDLNSVAPATKCTMAELVTAAGGRYVEAAVMSPIGPKRIAAPILVGGPHAAEFLPLAMALGFSGMRCSGTRLGTAAATKMCRSVIVKGTEALLSEALLAARHYGVEDAVVDSLSDLFPRPDWAAHAHYMISRTLLHGTRRAEEMAEAARTVADAGITPYMSEATVARQAWAAGFAAALTHTELTALLDAMRAQVAASPIAGNSE